MRYENSSALDYKYLLLEFYKQLNIAEREVLVILMIEHLMQQGNDFITSDLLALRMNLPQEEIDESLTVLFTKGYLEYIDKNGDTYTSLNSLHKLLIKTFEKSVYTDDEMEKNEELEERRNYIFEEFMKVFERNLSPVEIYTIDGWLSSEVDSDIIINALKDAKKYNKLNIKYIDRLIVNRIKEEDLDGNEIK